MHASLLERGELTARVHLFPTLLDDMSRFEDMRARYTGPCLQAPGFKQFFDGVSSQHTAWVTEPYASAHVEGDCGRPTVDPEIMRRYVLAAAEQGFPVRIHAIGDAAIHAALDIFEEARVKFGPLPEGRRNCLEHLENFLPGDMKRLADLQVVAAVQPPHMTLDPGGPERDLGPERVPYMWPFRTLLDDNTVLAFGTDSPVVGVNSMDVLYSAVTRQDPGTHEPTGGWLHDERIGIGLKLCAPTRRAVLRRQDVAESWARWKWASWPTSPCSTAICWPATPTTSRRRRCWPPSWAGRACSSGDGSELRAKRETGAQVGVVSQRGRPWCPRSWGWRG